MSLGSGYLTPAAPIEHAIMWTDEEFAVALAKHVNFVPLSIKAKSGADPLWMAIEYNMVSVLAWCQIHISAPPVHGSPQPFRAEAPSERVWAPGERNTALSY